MSTQENKPKVDFVAVRIATFDELPLSLRGKIVNCFNHPEKFKCLICGLTMDKCKGTHGE